TQKAAQQMAQLPAMARNVSRVVKKTPAICGGMRRLALLASRCGTENYPQGESNPCFRTENPESWATRRWGPENPAKLVQCGGDCQESRCGRMPLLLRRPFVDASCLVRYRN